MGGSFWKTKEVREKCIVKTVSHGFNCSSEVASSDEQSAMAYANDGSKKQGAGSFTVEGIIINGKYRALPTMSITSESKTNLAELKLTTLQILSAASGAKAKVLFERMDFDFVISDQTAHNIDVELLVAKELGTEKVPNQLFYNVHPCLCSIG